MLVADAPDIQLAEYQQRPMENVGQCRELAHRHAETTTCPREPNLRHYDHRAIKSAIPYCTYMILGNITIQFQTVVRKVNKKHMQKTN